ncbi:MAG: ATP-binding protein [Lachnospiraceae bacterium]
MRIKLQGKIILGIVIILLLSSIVTMFLSMNMLLHNTDEAIERNLFNVGETAAHLPDVIDGLKGKPGAGGMQEKILSILESSSDIDYIVVCNMDSIRYSHLNPGLIGLPLVGGDDARIKEQPERYISVAEGTLGISIRSFVPVFDHDMNTQLGFIVTGTLRASIQDAQRQLVMSYLIYLFSGLLLGVGGAYLLARNIKKSLLGLEPDDLAKLYRENKGMMEALHEGIIATDQDGLITLLNESAKELLGVDDSSLGKDIRTILPNSRLPDVAENGVAEYDQVQTVLGRVIITNRVPIMEKGKANGAIATFRDKTMMIELAEQLTGARHLVESLRASTHEFMNKMHTLLGLLELSEYDRAKSYILEIQKKQQDLNKRLFNNFKDPVIAGLILGKVSASKEQGVRLQVAPDSHICMIKDYDFSHTLVTIVGNLIDNAVESARLSNQEMGEVQLLISQTDEEVEITVSDNGAGIAAENRERIFEREFSTKGKARGMGLYLIRQEIEKLGGTIHVASDTVETIFSVILPYQSCAQDQNDEQRDWEAIR